MFRRDVAGLERRCNEAVHRGDDEEPAVGRCGERIPCVLREEERTRQQERLQLVPLVFREVADRRDVLKAGVRDNCVE